MNTRCAYYYLSVANIILYHINIFIKTREIYSDTRQAHEQAKNMISPTIYTWYKLGRFFVTRVLFTQIHLW